MVDAYPSAAARLLLGGGVAGSSNIKDRTNEFRSLVDSYATQHGLPTSSSSRPGGAPRAGGGAAANNANGPHAATSAPNGSAPTNSGGAGGGGGVAGGSGIAKGTNPKSEFTRRAHAIGTDITQTTAKLARLAQLAKRKTMFDDRPVEISELTYVIKHDLAAINRQLADLQAFVKAQQRKGGAGGGGGAAGRGAAVGRVDEHRGNVVTLLQTKLAGATTSFQDILEVRTQNMKASKSRTEQFAYNAQGTGLPSEQSVLRSRHGLTNPSTTANGATTATAASSYSPDSPLYRPSSAMAAGRSAPNGVGAAYDGGYDAKGKGKASSGAAAAAAAGAGGYNVAGGKTMTAAGLAAMEAGAATGGGPGQEFLALDMGNNQGGGSQYMQMQLMDGGQESYMQQRSTAIESIESTISELGQIFGQLAHMVAEQRETVQRIDADVLDVADNVSGAQRELLRFYQSVSSNRWLMLKIFGTLIVFFLVFILVS